MITREKVRLAIKDIHKFHALGRRALNPDGSRRKLTEADAAKVGTQLPTWLTARQFAEDYDRQALDELYALIKTQVGREGNLLGKTAVMRLLRVPPARRFRFLKTALARGWSTHAIEREIARRYGTRRSGGRPPSLPADEAGLCQLLEKLSEQWLRLYRRLSRNDGSSESVSLRDLAPSVRRKLSMAVGDLTSLQAAATRRLGELQSDRVERKPLADHR